ncbi:ribokinase [Superficieibacter electus]|uniref:Ribokinase n=1 Tax=Superficieibacter electus TaxID=2022662 RepID=A0A2P5GQB1_9ENTR|nr:PfkB family carbohydrate kinase [Superficieibacter electus]POP45601.1 ribokinase [Superficieibacter electus]POP48762.1 ribokinase [Superficieibacter electus]
MNVIGIGDNVVDKYAHTRTMYPGGNALNFSVYAKMLGHRADYLGIFGNDSAAQHVISVVDELGINRPYCLQVEGENGCAQLKIEHGERIFLGSNAGGIRKTTSMDFIFEHKDYLHEFALIHSGCYSYIEDQLPALHQLGIPLSYDFSDDFVLEQALPLCRYVDFAFFSCAEYSPEQTQDIMMQASKAGSGIVCATRGSEGALLYDGKQWYHQRPQYVVPVDTMGAGDAFITAFVCHYLATTHRQADEALVQSLQYAADFSAQICLKEGAFGYGIHY